MKKFLKLYFFLVSLLICQTSTDIKQAKSMMKNLGISKDQAIEMAKKKGYSDNQIKNAIEKEEKTKSINRNSTSLNKEELTRKNEIGTTINGKNIVSDNSILKEKIKVTQKFKKDNRKELEYFGYKIFQQDPELFQSSGTSVLVPNYLIGPGDEIIIMLWGETQFRQALIVDKEGFVFIPGIGKVFVNGLNLNFLEAKLFRVFSQSYASLNPQGKNATTFLDISIGNLRPLRIQVLGQVEQPGAYTVSPSATLFSSLYYFNGPTKLGSLREIQLIRDGEIISTVDFYDYLLTGMKPDDVKLQLDDVIFIPTRLKTVSIKGEINLPGIYELKQDENLKDLISFAGGLKTTAFMDRAQLDRVIPYEDREKFKMERMYVDFNLHDIFDKNKKNIINDGDKIEIYPISEVRENSIMIIGSVGRPGKYDLGVGLTLNQLIKKAGGLTGDALQKRVDITRTMPDLSEELIYLNMDSSLTDLNKKNFKLQSNDIIRIYGRFEMVEKESVLISGFVKAPGRYTLKKNMRIHDLIFIAGGIIDKEFKKLIHLGRADLIRYEDGIQGLLTTFSLEKIIKDPNSDMNQLLQPGDLIKIYRKDIFQSTKPITINGKVRKPDAYEFKENMTIKDLILEADGFSDDYYNFNVEVVRFDTLASNYKDLTRINFKMNNNFKVISNKYDENFLCKPYDIISIRNNPHFKNFSKVSISGEVNYPGDYIVLKKGENINDIINRAGGLLNTAFPNASICLRNGKEIHLKLEKILNKPQSKYNFTVQDGDNIYIPKHLNYVQIFGEVNNPGVMILIKNKRMNYYINNSGGLSSDADRNNIWVKI